MNKCLVWWLLFPARHAKGQMLEAYHEMATNGGHVADSRGSAQYGIGYPLSRRRQVLDSDEEEVLGGPSRQETQLCSEGLWGGYQISVRSVLGSRPPPHSGQESAISPF